MSYEINSFLYENVRWTSINLYKGVTTVSRDIKIINGTLVVSG